MPSTCRNLRGAASTPRPEADMNMKHRVLTIVSAVAALAFATAAPSALAAAAGQTAPDFTLTDTHGKAVRLSDYRGKYVVLEWTNPDCPFVQRHYSTRNMPGLQKEWGTHDVRLFDQVLNASFSAS